MREYSEADVEAARRWIGWRTGLVFGLALVLGAVIGVRWWNQRLLRAATSTRPYATRPARVDRPVLIINRWSGDGKAKRYDLERVAQEMGIDTVVLERGDDLAELARNAIDQGADAVGMAGGDGSLGIVAGVAVERDVPFFCVPVGTRNHFALDLGLDRNDPLAALDALRGGSEISIDYGVVGERVFLNNVSFGVYAQAVHRDGYRENKEATIATVVSEISVDGDAQAVIRYSTPDGFSHDRVPLLLVSNNPYTMSGPPDFGRRLRLDGGQLGIVSVTNASALSDPLMGGPVPTQALFEWVAASIELESDEPILAGVDGEAESFDGPLEVSIRPRGLRVLVPEGAQPGYMPIGDAAASRAIDLLRVAGEVDS